MEQTSDGQPMRRTTSRQQAMLTGGTLVLIVLVLFLILIVFFNRFPDDSKSSRAIADMMTLTRAVANFKLLQKRYPDQLDELMHPPDGGKPFMESKQNLIDPWGNPYGYDPAGPQNQGNVPDIWAVDPDGKVIGNWMRPR